MTSTAEAILRAMTALPIAGLDAIAPGNSLILAPHPDDESLGCGGLIAESCVQGRPPLVVCVTDGAASHPGSRSHPPARLKATREAEMLAACAILGLPASHVAFLGLADSRMTSAGATFEAAARTIAALARNHAITTIFATWPHDPHGDHAATALLGRHAADLAGTGLTFYPVWGWTLPPDRILDAATPTGARLDITRHLPAKRRAIAAHASQYADLITDSPNGFRLPQALLSVFDRPYETFLDP